MDLVSDYLLRHAARTGLSIVLSTGFGTMEEMERSDDPVLQEFLTLDELILPVWNRQVTANSLFLLP